jgi:hypothetical protein
MHKFYKNFIDQSMRLKGQKKYPYHLTNIEGLSLAKVRNYLDFEMPQIDYFDEVNKTYIRSKILDNSQKKYDKL